MKGTPSPIILGVRFGATILAGFVAALIVIAVIGIATYRTMKSLVRTGDRAAHNHQVIDHLQNLHFLLNDAETRQRDYLITGDQYNLELYRAATAKIDGEVHLLANDNSPSGGSAGAPESPGALDRRQIGGFKGLH